MLLASNEDASHLDLWVLNVRVSRALYTLTENSKELLCMWLLPMFIMLDIQSKFYEYLIHLK
jgi:hypothetical protein